MPYWVHDFFHPKRDGAGDYRCCKICYSDASSQPPVEDLARFIANGVKPGYRLRGVILNNNSPGAMINHFRDHVDHHKYIPQATSLMRCSSGPLGESVDRTLLRDWSTHLVLGELLPIKLIGSSNMRAVLGSLARRHRIRAMRQRSPTKRKRKPAKRQRIVRFHPWGFPANGAGQKKSSASGVR